MNVNIGTEAAQFLFWVIKKWDFRYSAVSSINRTSNAFAEYEQKNIKKQAFPKLNCNKKIQIIAVNSSLCANLTQLFCNSEKYP
jgi:hypothetical protein